MCYYNGQKVSWVEFIRLKEMERDVNQFDFLNNSVISGFSGAPVAVLKPSADETNFDIVQMEWGFIGPYIPNRHEADIFKRKYTTMNANAENLFTNDQGRASMWASAAKKRRCLMLSTGFYEWRHVYPVSAKTGQLLKTPVKYPYYISLKEQDYFYMAAIWQEWTDRETGETVECVANVTTKANALMQQVHNSKERMPTILNDDLAYEWMFGDLSEDRITEIAAMQYPSMSMWKNALRLPGCAPGMNSTENLF